MRKPTAWLFLLILAAAGWVFTENFRIAGLDQLTLKRRAGGPAGATGQDVLPVQRTGQTVRIASFNIQVFGQTKASKPHVMEILARIIRQFDIVAVQEIRSLNQDVLPQLVETVNAAGRHYDYVIGPRLGRTSSKEQYAFVFDRASIEVDRSQLYTIEDPDDLLHRPPLVAWFRVRGPPPDQAFTFSLVNVHTDPDEVYQELNALDNVFYAVRDDGRGEDDVIVLGDLNASDRQLGELGAIAHIGCVIANLPTNTRGTEQYDNILFHQQATTEFTGRSGVFDFLRQYNMTMEQALEVSDHLPVWAEFSVYEGGTPGHIAARPEPLQR